MPKPVEKTVAAVFTLSATLAVFLLYSPLATSPQAVFTSKYVGLVLLETSAVVSLLVVLVPPLSTRFAGALSRQVDLGRRSRAAALVVLAAGLFLFVFWSGVDFLSGYFNFPLYAFHNYPVTQSIYDAVGLNLAPIPDKFRVIGTLGFAAAAAGFMALGLRRGVGVALRETTFSFAIPLVIAFELGLWYCVPAEMYWHFASFAPWSLGRYLTANQFSAAFHQEPRFDWAGNVYLVSNWFVLVAACGTLALGLAPVLRARNRGLGRR